MIKTWIVWGVILFCFLTETAASADISESQLVYHLASGTINWRKGIVEAKGTGVPPKSVRANQLERSAAIKDAIGVASHNLFGTLQEIRIDTDTKLSDVIANNQEIANKLKTLVKEAAITRRGHLPDGTVEVTLQMSLCDGFAHLILPPEIKYIESVQPIQVGKTSKTATSPDESEPNCTPKCYTGIVVDARGIGFKPAMAPRIIDENGDEVFGTAFASREFAVKSGMVGYTSNLGMALKNPRVMDHPMMLKGLTTKGQGHCDIIVSVSDANRLRSNFNHLSFLKKCRVMIVLDPFVPKK